MSTAPQTTARPVPDAIQIPPKGFKHRLFGYNSAGLFGQEGPSRCPAPQLQVLHGELARLAVCLQKDVERLTGGSLPSQREGGEGAGQEPRQDSDLASAFSGGSSTCMGGRGAPGPPRMDRAAHPRSLTVVPWQLGPHVHPAHHAWLVGTSWTFTSPPHLEARPILAKPRCTHCPEPRARPGLDFVGILSADKMGLGLVARTRGDGTQAAAFLTQQICTEALTVLGERRSPGLG